jgi:predicted TIM-barrel fold metal-dependent hydrolase
MALPDGIRSIIDCDIHVNPSSVEVLLPYLSEHWREYIAHSDFKGPVDTSYPPGAPTTARPGAVPPSGGPAGSDLALLREQVLDPLSVELGILSCDYAVDSVRNPDTAAALSRALNDWQAEDWLDQEPRLRASVVVPSQIPTLAAEEIDRVGSNPGFIQIFLPARSESPYGNRRFHPIYEAAVRHNLVISIHFGGSPGNPPSGAGWPSYYLEEYAGMAQVFQSQVLSMIAEGVFDRFPTLKVTLVESGFTWMPALMWRLDKEWKGLRREVPWVRRPPSEYIHEHMRLTTQPVDAPPDPIHLAQVIDQLGSDNLLMFSTDYPHNHSDQSEIAWLEELPDPLRRNIMSENARAFFGFS